MTAVELEALLARLDEAWRSQGADIAGNALPGLTDAQIDERITPLGVVLPEELRTWWRWHDGVRGGLEAFANDYDEASIGPGEWQLVSLDEAVERYQFEDRTAQYAEDPIAGEYYWRDSWFPFVQAGSNDVLFVDTTVLTEDRTSPIRCRLSWNWDGWDAVQAHSLADAVAVWLRALTAGHYRWNATSHEWDHDRPSMPGHFRQGLLL